MIRKRLRNALWIVVFLCLLGFVGYMISDAEQTSQGKPSYKHQATERHGNDKNYAAYDVSLVTVGQIGKFLDEHNGAITALSGIAVAVFTGTLWWVTKGMAKLAEREREDTVRSIEAAERSAAAALTALPRGSIFCDLASSNLMAWTSGQAPIISVEVRFTNFGSAPAIIDFVVTKMEVAHDLPDWRMSRTDEFLIDNIIGINSHKDHTLVEGVVIGKQKYFGTDKNTVFGLSEDDIRLYILVRVIYHDIYKRSFETSYCVSYKTGNGQLRPEGDRDYNYQT